MPQTLGEAVEALEASEVYRAAFGDSLVDYLVMMKRSEIEAHAKAADASAWEMADTSSCSDASRPSPAASAPGAATRPRHASLSRSTRSIPRTTRSRCLRAFVSRRPTSG